MKSLFLIVFFVSFLAQGQDLKNIRLHYPKAVESTEITAKLDDELATVNSSSRPVLVAYKGAVLTLKAKFAKKKSDKKDFFKEGVSLIESAVKSESSNIEIRYIRLSVQENSPKFLGYDKNIKEDKQFILRNFATISSKDLKEIIKDFGLKSKNFDEKDKAVFKIF